MAVSGSCYGDFHGKCTMAFCTCSCHGDQRERGMGLQLIIQALFHLQNLTLGPCDVLIPNPHGPDSVKCGSTGIGIGKGDNMSFHCPSHGGDGPWKYKGLVLS